MQNVHKKEMRRYNFLLDRIRIESTDGNFGTHEKVAISFPILTCRPTFPIPVVTCTIPIPIFGILVFPFPCTSLIQLHKETQMCIFNK